MNYIFIICMALFLAGELLPWIQARSMGISLRWFEFGSPLIKRNIFAYKHNKKVFEALHTIRQDKLDISFEELENMYKANVNFPNVIDALQLIKRRGIKVSKDDLRTLAYSSNKDLVAIVNAKNPGEEILLAEVFPNKLPVMHK